MVNDVSCETPQISQTSIKNNQRPVFFILVRARMGIALSLCKPELNTELALDKPRRVLKEDSIQPLRACLLSSWRRNQKDAL